MQPCLMEKIYDIIIIGGGPSGMTSALYSLRAGKSVLILEKENAAHYENMRKLEQLLSKYELTIERKVVENPIPRRNGTCLQDCPIHDCPRSHPKDRQD